MSKSGTKNFDGCQNRIISTRDASHGYFIADLDCPRTELNNGEPVTSNRTHYSQERAKRDLRKVAGNLICENCPFATKDPLEVSEYQAAIAANALRAAQDGQIRAEVVKELQTNYPDQHWT